MSCIIALKSSLVLLTPRTGRRQLDSLSGYRVGDLDPCGEALFKGKGFLRLKALVLLSTSSSLSSNF